MKTENRRYKVEYKDGTIKEFVGYQNLPTDKKQIKIIRRVSSNSSKKFLSDYLCFADMEFTCVGVPGDIPFDVEYGPEILSIGLVISHRTTGEVIDMFYSTVKPKHNILLTRRCKELTKLTQEEIDSSSEFSIVMEKLVAFCRKYKVNDIYTYGDQDKLVLKEDIKKHDMVPGLKKLMANMEPVDKFLAKQIFGQKIQISLQKMKMICKSADPVVHNALSDAKDLCFVWFRIIRKEYDFELAARMLEEIKWNEQYYQYRLFSSASIPHDFIPLEDKGKITSNILELIDCLQNANKNFDCIADIKLVAFCDDLLKLAGLPPKGFSGKQERIMEEGEQNG